MGPHRNFFLALVPLVRLRGYFLLGPNCRPHVRWVDHPSRHLGWKCGSCCLICFCDYCGCGRCWVRDCRWEWCGVRHWQRGVNNLGPGILGSWHMKNTCCQGNLGALPLEICILPTLPHFGQHLVPLICSISYQYKKKNRMKAIITPGCFLMVGICSDI